LLTVKFLRKISSELQKNIKEQMPHIYNQWIKQFYRKYAKRLTERRRNQRNTEWNLGNGNTFEFRSFNLLGIDNWADFHKIMDITFKTIRGVILEEFENEEPLKEKKALKYKIEEPEDVIVVEA